MGIDKDDAILQKRLTDAFKNMKAEIISTCVPYLTGGTLRFGEYVVWGELAAVVYINSVLGARTNREGGPSGLAATLVGRVPEYGFHFKKIDT